MPDMFEKGELNVMEKAIGDANQGGHSLTNTFCEDLVDCSDLGHSIMSNQKANNLDGILLNQGLDNNPDSLTMMTPAPTPSHIKQETQPRSADRSPNMQQSWHLEQMRAVSQSPLSHVQGIPQNPANSPHALSHRNQHLRNRSNLRNQFNPNILCQTSSPSLINYSTVPYATPPAQNNFNPFQYSGGPGTMINPIRQPFDESNMRSPVNQTYGYPISNQASSQAYPVYSHQQHYSPNAQFRSPFVNVNTQFGQPRTPPRMTHLGDFQHKPDLSGSGASNTRRVTSQGSPTPQVKREDSTGKRPRKTIITLNTSEDDEEEVQLPTFVPEEDAPLVRRLIAAMTDASAAEDNEGMKKTWNKIRVTRMQRVQEKAVEMLKLCRDAQYQGVSDKKAMNQYSSFKHRFDELCIAVRTQKTICKHLMEEEYSRTVANDPTFAAQRVKNNRRVNDQKKIAIEVGRRQMGQQGHGKGRKVEQIVLFEEEENSADDPFSDEDGAFPSVDNKPDPPRRKKAKKNNHSDDDFEIITRTTPSSRKTRRETRSAQKAMSNGISLGSPATTRTTRQARTGQSQIQAMHSSPISQQSQLDHSNGQYHGLDFDDGSYTSTMASSMHNNYNLPQMVEEHSREICGHPHAYNLGHHQHQSSYSSGTDPTYSDDINGNGKTDTEGFCDSNFDIFGPTH